MNRPLLAAVVALAGAAVLVLEILGSRVLAPAFGAGLDTWSALIAVTLAALAAGYALGGSVADRGSPGAALVTVLGAAGLWTLLVPLMRAPALAIADGLGPRGGTLAAAAALFLVPLVLLGMVSPLAVRLRARALDEVGRAAGGLWAISTLASVIAALAAGFWLIPSLGVARLLVMTGLGLLLAAVLATLGARAGRGMTAIALVAGIAAAWLAVRAGERYAPGTLMRAESRYSAIEVRDVGGSRVLLLDGDIHTRIRADDTQPLQAYVIASELVTETFPRGGRMLLVGLGGGAAARMFTRDGWDVDAVEIDPMVVSAATRHFRFRPGIDARVAVMDGRAYLRSRERRWDVVFLDAYGTCAIPFHLCSAEAFALARSRLSPGGVLVINVQALGWHDPLVHAIAATLRTRFAHVTALPTAEPPDRLGNVVLFASDRALEIPDAVLGDPVGSLSDVYEHWRVLQRRHAWFNRFEPAGGRVLTDDSNPVEAWTIRIEAAARREARELLADTTRTNPLGG